VLESAQEAATPEPDTEADSESAPAPEPTPEPAPDPEPAAPHVPTPAPAAPTLPARSENVTRVDLIHVRSIRTVIILGDVEIVSYDDATTGITLSWRRPRTAPMAAAIHAGSCAAPGEALLELRPLEPTEEESTLRVPVSGSALRLGGFVVLVTDAGGDAVGCADLRR
jgi:hypothetical protein